MKNPVYVFPNGIRLLYINNQSEISHCGLMIAAGSRNEEKGKEGLAHFIEHVLFKGTRKRNAYHVLNRLDIVGGELNAYTAKEETCVHASMLSIHFERAVELITDIVFNSIFPIKEIEKEKEVVLDEINSYQENPAEQIYDDFDCMMFRGQPLGNPVLGTPESVRSFSRKDILEFIKKNYTNDRIIFAYSGNLSFDDVIIITEKYLGDKKNKLKFSVSPKCRAQKPKNDNAVRPVSHSHFILGNTAYSGHHKKRFPLYLLNNILGGPGMNSRLNLMIREKYGFTYHIESNYMPFSDTGLFNVYFATESKFLEKCQTLVYREFEKLKSSRISNVLLNRYKYQLKGQIAIARENRSGELLNSAKSVLMYNQPLKIESVFRSIDAISSSDILEVANEVLNDKKMSSLHYMPDESDLKN